MQDLVLHFILNQYAVGERNGRFPAATLFVDIGGFSIMTDVLMQHGQHGAEVLATVMNSVFDPLVHGVYEQGGFISGFAGDAFTAVFLKKVEGRRQKAETEDTPSAFIRAVAAGCAIQQQMTANADHDTPYGHFGVSAKVGAAPGEVVWGIISSADGRRAGYYFQGPAIDGCAAAEKVAQANLEARIVWLELGNMPMTRSTVR